MKWIVAYAPLPQAWQADPYGLAGGEVRGEKVGAPDADCGGVGDGAYLLDCVFASFFPGCAVEPFLARLRLAMDQRGLTQRDLARALGVREATVSAWFQQGKLPSGTTMLALPGALQVDGHWLLTGEQGGAASVDPDGVAELKALLSRALAVLQPDGTAGEEPVPVRVRAATEGEQRALDAARRFGAAGRTALPRETRGR